MGICLFLSNLKNVIFRCGLMAAFALNGKLYLILLDNLFIYLFVRSIKYFHDDIDSFSMAFYQKINDHKETEQ